MPINIDAKTFVRILRKTNKERKLITCIIVLVE